MGHLRASIAIDHDEGSFHEKSPTPQRYRALMALNGAGNGTRTRECQLGKLMPYHLAIPAFGKSYHVDSHAGNRCLCDLSLKPHIQKRGRCEGGTRPHIRHLALSVAGQIFSDFWKSRDRRCLMTRQKPGLASPCGQPTTITTARVHARDHGRPR